MASFRPIRLLKNVICRFHDDEVPALGAQITYYLILSFFPFLIFLLTLTAYTPLKAEQITADITAALPESTQSIILSIHEDVSNQSSPALLSAGMLAGIWTASSGMMALSRTLNKAYDDEETRPYWKVRLLAVVYTIGFTAAVWLSFALLVFGQVLGKWLFDRLTLYAEFERWWVTLKYLLSLLIMALIFTLLYIGAPSRKMKWREVIPGSIFATVGWVATSLLFSLYVNRFGTYAKTYGSLGGIIVLLVWLYLSSIILLLGGELNAALVFDRQGKEKTECKAFGFRLPLFKKTTKN